MSLWDPADLNADQEAAIAQDGSVFLVACPGSGKTRCLAYKIVSELSKLGTKKKWVVAITYTHRAADEIRDRIELLGVDTSQLWIGTIHSFCLEWILRPYAIYHDQLKFGFRVINSYDTERILTALCKPYRNPSVSYYDCGHFYTPDGLKLSNTVGIKTNAVHKILEKYRSSLADNNQIDFELILHYAYQLISSIAPIKGLLSSMFSAILIDEYQDTKEIQYSILAMILKAGAGQITCFVVGDPNQSIYTSMGGFAITAQQFSNLCDMNFVQMELSQNYRSSSRIVEYFNNYRVNACNIIPSGVHKDYESLITFDKTTSKDDLGKELVRLIRYNIEELGIAPHEVCVVAPWWVHLGSMTRMLVAAMPDYQFDGPGMVPFSRDIDNFWYKLSKILLTAASPRMYVRRLRWAGEVLVNLEEAGIDVSNISRKTWLRECNSILSNETDGLLYLEQSFDALFNTLQIDFKLNPTLVEHHSAFFESSSSRVARLRKEGSEFIGELEAFRRVFENRSGITVSTIHGVKGAEYDTVIGYALLEGMVPHFSDDNPETSAKRMLYVLCSRARKNLCLISERDRINFHGDEYAATNILAQCLFEYGQLH